MQPLFSVAQIRQIEQTSPLPPAELMQRAAHAVKQWLQQRLHAGQSALFLAGPGNNGGDALLAAALLATACPTIFVEVWLAANPKKLPYEAAGAYATVQQQQAPHLQIKVLADNAQAPTCTKVPDWIVDGLFGIGLTRAIEGRDAQLLQYAQQQAHQGAKILALDVPSGLNVDSGYVVDSKEGKRTILPADHTLTMIGLKPGFYMVDGRDYTGEIHLNDLDIPAHCLPKPCAVLNELALFQAALPRRYHRSHKGSHGALAIIGGGVGMIGAPLLSARAALFGGAGKVKVGLLQQANLGVDILYPELMITLAAALRLEDYQTLLLGPGMGSLGVEWIAAALEQAVPCVLDADALNQIAASPLLRQSLTTRGSQNRATILTPHPLEAARLLACSVDVVQHARLDAAAKLARQFKATIVLKGSGTVIAAEDEQIVINPTGNGALASAGTGDVLAGLIAALVVQGMPTYLAACAGVWLHGQAADDLVAQGQGPVGLNASALAAVIRQQLNSSSKLIS